MKILLKKEIYGTREQCAEPTDRHILVKILLVKEVVGPVNSAQDPLIDKIPREIRDPLTDKIPHEMHFSIKKKKKKKENANAAPEMQSTHA